MNKTAMLLCQCRDVSENQFHKESTRQLLSGFDADVFDTSTSGKKELLCILHDTEIFDTVKPTKLYYELIKMSLSPRVSNPIILDFFAGSGTTGHAVMKFNSIETRDCKFILVTNNQNNICRDVAY